MESSFTDRRRATRSGIYHCLYETEGISTRQSLAQALGLSLPTIYQNLADLVDQGLVRYSGEAQSTGGRRAAGLEIVTDARLALGASLSSNRLRLVAADLRLREIAYRSIPCSTQGEKTAQVSELLSRELERFIDDNGLDRRRLLGVAVAIPAVLTPDQSGVILSPTLGLTDLEPEVLTRGINYPKAVVNDATCSGFAEWFARGARGSMAYLSLEGGVGGAVLINGSPYSGANLRSGEFGHMCVEPGGLPCRCGKHGCLEAYCSLDRISRELGISLTEFFDGLANHEPEYEIIWSDMLHHLAIGVANIRMALDCDVVLGGVLAQYLPPYLKLLKQYVAANDPFGKDAGFVQLGVFGRHAVPLGAALHFISSFLDNI